DRAGGWGGGAEAPAPVVAPEADEAAALVSALPPGLAPGFASTACPAGELAVFAPDLPSPSAFDPACGATFGSAFGATGGPLDASCGVPPVPGGCVPSLIGDSPRFIHRSRSPRPARPDSIAASSRRRPAPGTRASRQPADSSRVAIRWCGQNALRRLAHSPRPRAASPASIRSAASTVVTTKTG